MLLLKSVSWGGAGWEKGDGWEKARLQCVEAGPAGIANTFLLSFSAGAVVIVASKRVLLRRGRASKAEESSLPPPLCLSLSLPDFGGTTAFIQAEKRIARGKREGGRKKKKKEDERSRARPELSRCARSWHGGIKRGGENCEKRKGERKRGRRRKDWKNWIINSA